LVLARVAPLHQIGTAGEARGVLASTPSNTTPSVQHGMGLCVTVWTGLKDARL